MRKGKQTKGSVFLLQKTALHETSYLLRRTNSNMRGTESATKDSWFLSQVYSLTLMTRGINGYDFPGTFQEGSIFYSIKSYFVKALQMLCRKKKMLYRISVYSLWSSFALQSSFSYGKTLFMDNILTHSPFKATASKHFSYLLLNSSILKAQVEQYGITEQRYCWSQHVKQP